MNKTKYYWQQLLSILSLDKKVPPQEDLPQEQENKAAFQLFPKIEQEDVDFISDSHAALLRHKTPLAGVILYCILALLCIALIWAYFANIDQMTVGDGKVIPSSQVKIIQSLDGGIIASIDVKEGEMVKKNQILVTFDNIRYKADYEQGMEKYYALLAGIARLKAETQGLNKIVFPKELEGQQDLIDSQNKLFFARNESLIKEVNILQRNHELAQRQLKIYAPLVEKGIVAKIDYYRSEQSANEIQRNLMNVKNKFREDALTDLDKYNADLAVLTEALNSLKDKMQHTVIYAPVNGVIKKLYIHTIGAVIQTGEPILEVVPIEDSLLVQAKVKPSEIAFISLGQDATVKITAYDFSVYGSLKGKVEYISADTIEDSKANPTDKNELNYYLVNIRTQKSYLGNEKHKLPIMPGMNATVYIKTGKKTILKYILKPLIKAKEEALREH